MTNELLKNETRELREIVKRQEPLLRRLTKMREAKLTMVIHSKKNIKIYTRNVDGDTVDTKFTSLKKACEFVKKEMGGKEK